MLKKRGDDAGSGKGDNHLIPVEIHGLCPVADPDKLGQLMETFLVLLRDDGDRVVPITIGQFEGQVLYTAMHKKTLSQRPLAHNLLQNLIEEMKGEVRQLVIHTLKDGIFHAYMLIQLGERAVYLDCRPSDGMILSTLMNVDIFLSPEVMQAAGRAMKGLGDKGEIDGEMLAELLAAEAEEKLEESIELEAQGEEKLEEELKEELSELEKLEAQLNRLVSEEAYEEAAKVRDHINQLTQENKSA